MADSFDALLAVAGELRELVISDGAGGKKTIRKVVLWSRDALSRPTITKVGGVFLGDALLSVWEDDLTRRPLEGEFLESPAGVQWEILNVMSSNGVHYLALSATRAA
jgi:hypothetical protein